MPSISGYSDATQPLYFLFSSMIPGRLKSVPSMLTPETITRIFFHGQCVFGLPTPEGAIRCVHGSMFVHRTIRLVRNRWLAQSERCHRDQASVTLLLVHGLRGPVNTLDEGLGESTEGVLSEPFFLRDGSNVEVGRGGPAVEGINARSRSSNAGKCCSTVRSTLGAMAHLTEPAGEGRVKVTRMTK